MPARLHGPRSPRVILELLPQKLVTSLHINKHVLIGRARLIMHIPSPGDKLKLAVLQEFLNLVLNFECLLEIPVLEILNLVMCESPRLAL